MFQAVEEVYGEGNPLGPIELVAIGRFENNHPTYASDLLKDNAPHKFEVMQIERATKSEWAR